MRQHAANGIGHEREAEIVGMDAVERAFVFEFAKEERLAIDVIDVLVTGGARLAETVDDDISPFNGGVWIRGDVWTGDHDVRNVRILCADDFVEWIMRLRKMFDVWRVVVVVADEDGHGLFRKIFGDGGFAFGLA